MTAMPPEPFHTFSPSRAFLRAYEYPPCFPSRAYEYLPRPALPSTVARRVVTSARNRSRRMTRGYMSIAITGRYHSPIHSNCNLNYKNSFYIPVVFHNLSGYSAQFIIKEIATAYDGNVDLLPITKEKFISFTKHVGSIKDKNKNNFQKNCKIMVHRFFQISIVQASIDWCRISIKKKLKITIKILQIQRGEF